MTWRVIWPKRVQKSLASIPKKQRVMLISWVRENLDGCEDPRKVANGQKLVDTEKGWRYRVGAYRIICELLDDEVVIKIVRVGHRQGVYRSLPKL